MGENMAMTQEKLTLKGLTATTSDVESRIGHFVWYAMSERLVPKQQLWELFKASGLPEEYRIPEIRPADAFRRATKELEGRVRDYEGARFLIRDVKTGNRKEVVRHLVIETPTSAETKLDYDPRAAVFVFNHEYKTTNVKVFNVDDPNVVKAAEEFQNLYGLYLNHFDADARRRMVRSVLKDLSATPLKESGGVYLVPRDNEELLFQLVRFLSSLPHTYAYKLPVMNTEESRDMVRDVVTHKAQTFLTEMRAALKGQIDDKEVQALMARAHSIRNEIVTYQNILKESIGTLETDVDILQAQMRALLEQV